MSVLLPPDHYARFSERLRVAELVFLEANEIPGRYCDDQTKSMKWTNLRIAVIRDGGATRRMAWCAQRVVVLC